MNSVNIIGRITKDLDVRRAQSGTSCCSFSVAVDRTYKQPRQPDADFIGCKAFGKIAENMQKYLHKGSQVGITGHIQTGSYTNREGQKVYTTDVIADHVDFLDPKNSQNQQTNGYGNQNSNGYQNNYSQQSGGYVQRGFGETTAYNYGNESIPIDSGDLPF